jgi:hypothetical protein
MLCLSARSQAMHTAQVVPPAVLEFRKWLTVWSGESAKLQDANEVSEAVCCGTGRWSEWGVRTQAKDPEVLCSHERTDVGGAGRTQAKKKGSAMAVPSLERERRRTGCGGSLPAMSCCTGVLAGSTPHRAPVVLALTKHRGM